VLYSDGHEFREGVVGVALAGNIIIDTVVAQGCRPIGEPLHVTKADRNLLITVDDKPTMETLQDLFQRLTPKDQDLAQRNLFIGLAMDPMQDRVEAGEFLVRNIVGVDQQLGALAIGAEVREGQIVQFHVRDAGTSAEDLRASLSSYLTGVGDRRGAAALIFQCTGRGEYLYGSSGHDSDMFMEMVGSVPLAGFFCNGEIGRVSGATYVHSYTSSLAIFRERTGAW
jgi:small ligand-binding sensory domain FIST